MITESVILAIIGAISAIGVAYMTYHQKSSLDKLNDKQDIDQKLYEERLKIRELERIKDYKMEQAILANHELTIELARHIIEGNHIDLLEQKRLDIIEKDKELEISRKHLSEEYDKYNLLLKSHVENK